MARNKSARNGVKLPTISAESIINSARFGKRIYPLPFSLYRVCLSAVKHELFPYPYLKEYYCPSNL